MNRSRVLRLRREVLTELRTDELSLVVGGSHEPTPPIYAITYNCPTRSCVTLTDARPTGTCQ